MPQNKAYEAYSFKVRQKVRHTPPTPEPCPLPLLTRSQSKRDTTRDPTTTQFDQTDQSLDTLPLLL